ncbi:MAG: gamma-glutamyl-gamma-aminobutyrate hydrolase family protein [Cyanobacteria bacterium REEB65]|nr:gamma-glutamyl-gamma-aminobutyrate hydrolase family protein [Cyanobacteria bacterium REEB65]
MSLKPQIGVTWGRQVSAESLSKLACYVWMLRQAGAEPIAIVPGAKLQQAVANMPPAGLAPDPPLAGVDLVSSFSIVAGEAIAPKDFDGLLFAGGRDVDPLEYGESPATPTLDIDPERDAYELPLVRAAVTLGVPTFGICRGMQILNVALGGALFQDIPTQHLAATEHREGAFHDVEIASGSHLCRLAGSNRIETNSWHHQAIKLTDGLAPALRGTAVAPDGILEACEGRREDLPGYVVAVQWHPERRSPRDSEDFVRLSQNLFEDFVSVCAKR